MEIKIDIETAGVEVGKWLDYKRVKPEIRQMYAHYISQLVLGVCYGDLEINADFTIKHNLNFPITNKDGIVWKDSFIYKPRLTVAEIVSSRINDSQGMETIIKIASVATNEMEGTINKIDSIDLGILQAIVIFFT